MQKLKNFWNAKYWLNSTKAGNSLQSFQRLITILNISENKCAEEKVAYQQKLQTKFIPISILQNEEI